MLRSFRFMRVSIVAVALAGFAGLAMAQTASFTWTPASPAPFAVVSFTDTSVPTPSSWAWNFGDPTSGPSNTSTAQNPTHAFNHSGTYTVSLQVDGVASTSQVVTVNAPVGGCLDSPTILCLNGNRFSVSANWTKPDGETGTATAFRLTDDSGYFWFFDASNIELVTKVLDGCAINNSYWVFAAGLTNVQVNWSVTDTSTGAVYTQVNDQGNAFAPVQATTAFPTSCP